MKVEFNGDELESAGTQVGFRAMAGTATQENRCGLQVVVCGNIHALVADSYEGGNHRIFG